MGLSGTIMEEKLAQQQQHTLLLKIVLIRNVIENFLEAVNIKKTNSPYKLMQKILIWRCWSRFDAIEKVSSRYI
jgi:phosphate starvation-inducible membrane PsiE